MSITFLDRLSSSLLLICPYQFNRFCPRNVESWHTLASSCIIWFLTWSSLVLPLIHRSILVSATCNLFTSFFLTASQIIYTDSRISPTTAYTKISIAITPIFSSRHSFPLVFVGAHHRPLTHSGSRTNYLA